MCIVAKIEVSLVWGTTAKGTRCCMKGNNTLRTSQEEGSESGRLPGPHLAGVLIWKLILRFLDGLCECEVVQHCSFFA